MISVNQVKKYCCEDISNIENYEEVMKGKTWKLVDGRRVWK